MAINHTPKEKPTGDGNPTAGGINSRDFSTIERPANDLATLRPTCFLPKPFQPNPAPIQEQIGGQS